MHAWRRVAIWPASGVLLGVLLLLGQPAEARGYRHYRRNPVVAVVRPFLMVRAAIHGVADPIVYQAPLVVERVATAPIRVAYQATHYRAEVTAPVEDESEYFDDAPREVAYYNSRARRSASPNPERTRPLDDRDEDHGMRQAEAEEDFGQREGPQMEVRGRSAVLRNGVAQVPDNAPQRVKNAIRAVNTLRNKPYVWGGGHGSFYDHGYDCSGTVSFALHGAGALAAPIPSQDLMRYGERGRGRWITIYARPGHTFAVIAGLRLDTTDFRNGGNSGPRWHIDQRDTRGYVARHPIGM
ncbi:MAG: hypothetical protein ABI992_04685 [Chthoniobacterales bacterium]